MPDRPMSPRVRPIQFLAIACPMMTNPSVHITNEVARSLSAGMPSGSAIAPATAAGRNEIQIKGRAEMPRQQCGGVGADAKERRLRQRQQAGIADKQIEA